MADHLVSNLITQASLAPKTVSPVDAVMGTDWAHLKLRSPMSLGVLHHAVQEQTFGRLDPTRSGQGGSSRNYLEAAKRRPQAMVKLVATGGAGNRTGMQAQMNYLSREGSVPMFRSERFMGVEIDQEAGSNIVDSWHLRGGKGSADRTSHFVVSFPRNTDREAAERAGRAWAEEMFDSGRFGDEWDYYTTHHNDTDFPHTHVVASRRGMNERTWLTVSKRSEITFDTLRAVQVEVAAREGIELEATPRLARGLTDRPTPDAEYRRAANEARAPVAPSHSAESAIVAAASVIQFARSYEACATLIEDVSEPFADVMRLSAQELYAGGQIRESEMDVSTPEAKSQQNLISKRLGESTQYPKIPYNLISNHEVMIMANVLEELENDTARTLAETDEAIARQPSGPERIAFEARSAALKAEFAQLGRADMADYASAPVDQLYRGFEEGEAASSDLIESVDADTDRIVRRYGLNPSQVIARYRQPNVSKALALSWKTQEVAEYIQEHSLDPADDQSTTRATDQVAEMHASIATVYETARESLRQDRDGPDTGADDTAPESVDAPADPGARGRAADEEGRAVDVPDHEPEVPELRDDRQVQKRRDDDGHGRD